MEEERVVGHYLYASEEDAREAAKEEKQAAYLEARIDFSQRQNVRKIYEKALADRIFRTPPGLAFLSRLRSALIATGAQDVPPVPVFVRFTGSMRERTETARARVKREERKRRAFDNHRISLLLNVVLLAVVGILFFLTMSSPNPNILNYEQALVNKYASWEEELKERENVVRQAERELGIE